MFGCPVADERTEIEKEKTKDQKKRIERHDKKRNGKG